MDMKIVENDQVSNDRMISLFSDLRMMQESLEQLASSEKIENIQAKKEEADLPGMADPLAIAPCDLICPFLKASWDATVQYGFPNDDNFCYKGKKPKPVTIEHQVRVCYSKQHRKCPVAAPTQSKHRLLELLRSFI